MGVFACSKCGDPFAYNSWSPAGMTEHDAVCPKKDAAPTFSGAPYTPPPLDDWEVLPEPDEAPRYSGPEFGPITKALLGRR